ncbi:DarT ssDNA thymidine ADP-ribosyltransferase family protein [Roseovarius confluentis]|uniref:DarT ssDNA thymidine ADP-ribosyltransferase family protein n=1 Tax=Roseovarius confluentis TaxID=1852027 RepID=UPI000CDD75E6|nr:DarT ssDNA thymidine ADP-ribosyltransferase family protein [Roseovarius confluentis]
MKWLIIFGGIIVLLALVEKLKLFGAPRDPKSSDDRPLTTRETAAGMAAAGGHLLRSANEATNKFSSAIQQAEEISQKLRDDAKADLAHLESPLGQSLLCRKAWLSSLMKVSKHRIELQEELDADPEFAREFEKVRQEFKKAANEKNAGNPAPVSANGTRDTLRELGFWGLPADLRMISIPFLCHFTRIENLPSILEHGIVPVALCPEHGIKPITNDNARFDRRTQTSSLSVGHPNARMLRKYRQIDPNSDWVVLAVNVAIALSLDTLFCPHNAADARVSRLPDADLLANKAFQRMFERPQHYTGRAGLNQPTDDQAEILIPRVIPPSEIQGVFFLTGNGWAEHAPACGNRAIFDPKQSEAIFGRRVNGSLNHNARIMRGFDRFIEEITEDIEGDPRLVKSLNELIREQTQRDSTPGLIQALSWYRR